jgi:vancomycin permeability regulator SanA
MWDVIIVLGGGINKDGTLYPWVKLRFDIAIEFYKNKNTKIIPCTGTSYHNKPLIKDGNVWTEADAGAKYLMDNDIPAVDILKEDYSRDTIGNAYFSLTMHCLPAKFEKILVITSQFHQKRSKIIFDWIYGIVGLEVFCLGVVDNSFKQQLGENVYDIRCEREEISCENTEKLKKKYTTLQEVHRWLYSDHNAYSTESRIEDPIDDKVKESY